MVTPSGLRIASAATATSPSSAPHEGEAGLCSPSAIPVALGVGLWREYFSRDTQNALLDEVLRFAKDAPFYRPVMPNNGKPFSVEQTNFGPLGWVSDKTGYRYQPTHPVTGKLWPEIPQSLLTLWQAVVGVEIPDCCLVNLYRGQARMGLHQDRDETADAPVVSVSLGDSARFRIGGASLQGKMGRGGPTRSLILTSGDVLVFGGVARRAYHGIDRILPGTSTLLAGGGRINLTLRRVV